MRQTSIISILNKKSATSFFLQSTIIVNLPSVAPAVKNSFAFLYISKQRGKKFKKTG